MTFGQFVPEYGRRDVKSLPEVYQNAMVAG
jgi:hypothetical protein